MNKILLVRHDKIGDFVLTWPAFYLVRTAFPEARIEVLVAPGMEAFARLCPYIDDVLTDGDDDTVTNTIVERSYDTAIALHSPWRICKIFRAARIPYTLGPKHKWYQYLYKDRTSAKYKQGEPCWRGNCMIVEHFIRRNGIEIPQMPSRLWDNSAERERWQDYYGQSGDERLVFVHPGTGGSSGSLPTDTFVDLLKTVHEATRIPIKLILTFSGEEQSLAERPAATARCPGTSRPNWRSRSATWVTSRAPSLRPTCSWRARRARCTWPACMTCRRLASTRDAARARTSAGRR